ncbi:MAG: 30S ribosome-binding factor RbfA [Candidatus Moranbacteria bacterium]|nr:30S ribosome-binding factor RbfA [Candidatus Moranbacteria bacterium]
MSNRIEKVNQLVREELSKIISREFTIKQGVFISISKVDCSKDLRQAKVFVSIYPSSEEDYALKTLQKEVYKIQGILNRKLKMKPLPKIQFISDHSQENVEELEEIFRKIREEDNYSN